MRYSYTYTGSNIRRKYLYQNHIEENIVLQNEHFAYWGRNKKTPFRRRHFQVHFLEWFFLIPIKISPKFVPDGPINNIPALVQIMAWRRPGAKPLSEPMMVTFPTHICVTRPQWVKAVLADTPEITIPIYEWQTHGAGWNLHHDWLVNFYSKFWQLVGRFSWLQNTQV